MRVKFFFQKRSNGKGVAHSTCLKSARVDHFRCSRAENEAFVWEGWKKVSTKAESGKGDRGGERRVTGEVLGWGCGEEVLSLSSSPAPLTPRAL